MQEKIVLALLSSAGKLSTQKALEPLLCRRDAAMLMSYDLWGNKSKREVFKSP